MTAGFADPDGADNVPGTADDNLRLTSNSTAIDHGCGTELPLDVGDADGDGNTVETLPVDFDNQPRLVDEAQPNSGLGALPYLDFGAYEFDRDYIVLYVNDDVDGGNGDGSTWENAFKDLQEAITVATTHSFPEPVEIWVAEGTYLPSSSDRSASFAPSGNLKMYGGFEGVETSRSERRPLKYPTILSGEINTPSPNDNSFHVLSFVGDNVVASTVVDGFVITGGNANGSGLHESGGGVQVRSVARPTIQNCRFLGNQAANGGGAVAIHNAGSGGVFFNCYFANNLAARGGAIVLTESANACEIVNCTIANNHAEAGGGIFASNRGTQASILNTIFTLNTHSDGEDETAHLFAADAATIQIGYSALPCGAALGDKMITLPPRFNDLDGDDDLPGTLDDNLTLGLGSPCLDAGGSAYTGVSVPIDAFDADDDGDTTELAPFDIDGSQRVIDDPLVPDVDPDLAIDIGTDESDALGAAPGLIADFNGDERVDGADLAILLGFWGGFDQTLDVNGDCSIGGADLAVLLGQWTG